METSAFSHQLAGARATAMDEAEDDVVPSPARRTPWGTPGGRGRYRSHHRPSQGGEGPYISRQFLTFCVAAVAFFGLSQHMARQNNGAFERHFQELAKVKDDRRKLRTQVEALKAENERLRGEAKR
jgi:hypothetical protein